MSWPQGGAEHGGGAGHIPCPRCGHLNYPTDAMCLNCGADLDLARSQAASPHNSATASDAALITLDTTPAGGHDWRGPAAFLLWAVMFGALLLMVQVTGARPEPPGMLDLFCGLQLLGGVGALYELATAGRRESQRPIRPCRSPQTWSAMVMLSLVLAATGLDLALSQTRNVNRLAAAGRTELCPARIAGIRWVSSRSGVHPLYQVELTVGGQRFEDEVTRAILPPELDGVPKGQVSSVPVTWLPQDPAVHRLGGMSPAIPVLLDLMWGLDLLYLVVGLGLVCWYTAPKENGGG